MSKFIILHSTPKFSFSVLGSLLPVAVSIVISAAEYLLSFIFLLITILMFVYEYRDVLYLLLPPCSVFWFLINKLPVQNRRDLLQNKLPWYLRDLRGFHYCSRIQLRAIFLFQYLSSKWSNFKENKNFFWCR